MDCNKRLWVISIGIVILLVLLIKPAFALSPCEAQCEMMAEEKGGIFASSMCSVTWPGSDCVSIGSKTYASTWDMLPNVIGSGCCNYMDASAWCNYYLECDPSGPACNRNNWPPCKYLIGSTEPSANCSGISANYDCAVECAKAIQPAECELCCKCQATSTDGGGGGDDGDDDGRTRIAAAVIAADNLITGAALSCTSGYVPKLCSAIVNTSGNCNVCGCGVLPSTCNNDSICQSAWENEVNCPNDCGCNYDGSCNLPYNRGENETNCVFDCTPCTQRTNQTACEGNPSGTPHRWCKWCAMPRTSVFPYNLSVRYSELNLTNNFACLDTSADPFNCRGCGFGPDGLSSTPYFCDTSAAPFCLGGVCVGWRQSSCNAIQPISTPYYYYGITDTYVYDDSGENRSYYTYSSSWCDGNNTDDNPVYSISDYDQNDLVCSKVTEGSSYDFSSSLGCCGNNKCRAESGEMCGITSLCDGTRWHVGSESNGEVFRATCSSPYPIANINGEFVKCIDADRYDNYSLVMVALSSEGQEACVPAQNDPSIDFRLTGVLDYACGPNKYSYSTLALLDNRDICKVQTINTSYVTSGGDLVCVGWGDNNAMREMYGFATIYNRSINIWNSPDNEYAQCPAMPKEWIVQTTPEFVTSKPSIVVSCPGKEVINPNQIRNAIRIALYGGDSERAALFCKPGLPAGKENLGSLNYFKGDGSRMGSVNGRDYMCYTSATGTPGNRAKIAVCCGSQACSAPSTSFTDQIPAGGSVTVNGFLWTCMADGSWSSNLDFNYTQGVCTSSGFFATGTYCCSEPDDNTSSIWIKESYNQPGGPGGCFKGTRQLNNRLLSYGGVSYPNVYVLNGSFYGCGFGNTFTSEFDQDNHALCQPASDGSLSGGCLQSIENWPDPGADFRGTSTRRTHNPLINRVSYCTGFSTQNTPYQGVYCAFNNSWAYSFGSSDPSHMSSIPADLLDYFRRRDDPNLQGSGCCGANSCWGPGGCLAEQSDAGKGIYKLSDNLYYKCIQGAWVGFNHLKSTPDKCSFGFCPDSSPCMYRFINGTSSYLGCVANGQYVNDYLCLSGNWTSRTKMLASKLVNLIGASNNFVLMCGPPVDVLININISQSTGNSTNFCVMKLNGQRIIGTTLNQQFYNATSINTFFNSLMWSFNNAYRYMVGDVNHPASFDFNCDEDSTGFSSSCMGRGSDNYLELYYDRTYQMVIFSDQPINGLTPSFGDVICGALPSWLKWLCPSPPALSRDLEGVKLFNKIYAAKNGSKQVFGVAENMCGKDIYSFNYTGYLREELMPLILYHNAGVFANFTSDNTIFINKSDIDPWNPWTALTILRNLEQP